MSGLAINYTLPEYADFVLDNVEDMLDTTHVVDFDTTQVNGLQAHIISLFGALISGQKPLNVYYKMGIFQNGSFFYQLICWTSRKQQVRYEKDFERMVRSVRPIGVPPP